MEDITKISVGKRNLRTMYLYTFSSRLWFDGGLWVLYFQHRGLNLFQIGILEAILHIACLLSDVPVGIFADRFGWKLSLGIGCLLGIVYTTGSMFGHGFWIYAIAFAFRGLQVTFTNGSDSAVTYESVKWAGILDRYRAVTGRLMAITLISLGVAQTIGGALATLSWSSVYVAFTAANVVSFVCVLFMKEPRGRSSDTDDHESSQRESALTIVKAAYGFAKTNVAFVKWLVLSGVLSGFVATFGFYGQSLLQHAGWSLLGIGILTGVENGLGALAAALADRVATRFGDKMVMSWVGALSAIGLLLFAWLPGVLVGVGYLLDSIALNVSEPVINNGLNEIIPTEQRATLLSANSTAFSLFMVVGFPLFGLLSSNVGLVKTSEVFSMIGAFSILVATWWWKSGPKASEWNHSAYE